MIVDTNIMIRHFQRLINVAQGKQIMTTYGVINELKDQKTLEKYHLYSYMFKL